MPQPNQGEKRMSPNAIRRITKTQLDQTNSFLAREIRCALATNGLLLIEDALPADLVQRLFEEGQHALTLPPDVQTRYERGDESTGYTPPGIEGVSGHESDWKRHFWDVLSPERTENRFPDREIPAFRSIAEETFRHVEETAMRVLTCLNEKLCQDATGVQHMLRLSHYFAEHEADTILFPSHVDFGLLTFYVGGAKPGLQILIEETWQEILIPPTMLLASVGTTLRLYEPDFKPVRHRVMGHGRERLSAVFFTEPRAEVLLPNGVQAGEHLRALVDKVRKKTIL
jgi:isopenicillin N synthase-like dioxygenase